MTNNIQIKCFSFKNTNAKLKIQYGVITMIKKQAICLSNLSKGSYMYKVLENFHQTQIYMFENENKIIIKETVESLQYRV